MSFAPSRQSSCTNTPWYGVVFRRCALRVDRPAGRNPQHEARDVLAELVGGRAAGTRVGALEHVAAADRTGIHLALTVETQVVAGANRMTAPDPRIGRLHRIDAVGRRAAEVLAEIRQRGEVEQREIARAAEQRIAWPARTRATSDRRCLRAAGYSARGTAASRHAG